MMFSMCEVSESVNLVCFIVDVSPISTVSLFFDT